MTRDEAKKLLSRYVKSFGMIGIGPGGSSSSAALKHHRDVTNELLTALTTDQELLNLLLIAEDYLKQHWDMNSAPLNEITERLDKERVKEAHDGRRSRDGS